MSKTNDQYRVIDEKGVAHKTCHGVPAKQWFDTIRRVARELAIGLVDGIRNLSITELDATVRCDDPDCNRLNRLPSHHAPREAAYVITRPLPKVTPSELENERERLICDGHPTDEGKHLCEFCARVATAKRIINDKRKVYEHGGVA